MGAVVGYFYGEGGRIIVIAKHIQAEVAMLKLIHPGQGLAGEPSQQNSHGPTVHTDQDRVFVGTAQNQVDYGALAVHHLFGTFAPVGGSVGMAIGPCLNQAVIIYIVVAVGHFAFHDAPADFVQPSLHLHRQSQIEKRLHCLAGASEGRNIDLRKRHRLIGLKKRHSLRPAHVVEVSIDPATLYHAPTVIVRFSVTNDVNRFLSQAIFGCGLTINPEFGCEITENPMKAGLDLKNLTFVHTDSIANHLGIEFTDIGEGYLTARMPVDDRTRQPFGLLHGGASVVLAESLGSTASWLLLDDPNTQQAVGLEINANHLRAVRSGWVYGRVTPIHVGRTTHVWDIRITDEANKLVCISRLTVSILTARS